MCESDHYEKDLKPVKVKTDELHDFTYQGDGIPTKLLENIRLDPMTYNYAYCKKIHNEHGFKTGYMLVFGEKIEPKTK